MGSDEDIPWYGRRFFKNDILGNVIFEFDMSDSDGAPQYPGEGYRARLFAETELSSLITIASITVN